MIALPAVLLAVLFQLPGATLSGVVRDGVSGAPLAGAVVSLTDLERATVTDATGAYLFRDVPAGPQHLEIRRGGYAARTLHALVPASQPVGIDVSLEPRAIPLAGIAVVAPLAVRGAETGAEASTYPTIGLSAAAVRNHPLLAEPDFFAALSGGIVSTQPESPRGVHVRGGSADQVGYLLDGVPILSPFHSSGLFSAWNPDAIARVRLENSSLGSVAPEALSGMVVGEARRPGRALGTQGALSTTQARITVDGPLPLAGAGFLLSARRGFPGVFHPETERSYVAGGNVDWLAKVEGALGGGTLRLLGYENRNWAGTAAQAGDSAGTARNRFDWRSRSAGGEWARTLPGAVRLEVRGWSARADASSAWAGEGVANSALASSRADLGGGAILRLGAGRSRTTVGAQASRSETRYSVREEGAGAPAYALSTLTGTAALFAEHLHPVGARVDVEVGALAALYAGRLRLAPQVELRWSPSARLALSGSLSRTHQAEQSVGNAESVVGLVFPPSLYVGAGAPGIPVARSDQALLAVEAEPLPGVRVTAQGYDRDMRGLVLVAPSTGNPWAVDGLAIGSGRSRGGAVDLTVSRARYALLASYGYSRVRLAYADSSYVPSFAAAHTLDAGVTWFPRSTLALRLAVVGVGGRRSTALASHFEWEACNLLDRGCEFAGSPSRRTESIGATALPHYLRTDVGVRKHWHLRLGSAETVFGLGASATNLLGRRNLLAVSIDPVTGARSGIEMSSRSPLVVGIDWRF